MLAAEIQRVEEIARQIAREEIAKEKKAWEANQEPVIKAVPIEKEVSAKKKK